MDSQDAGWKDSMNDNNVMIVTIARAASENGSYNPGTAGVDPTQNLNQTDPLACPTTSATSSMQPSPPRRPTAARSSFC